MSAVLADVAAHGVHYAMVGVGLLLVVALLWSGRSRRRADEPAAGEHERRVAELREAARQGRLAAPSPPDGAGRRAEPDTSPGAPR